MTTQPMPDPAGHAPALPSLAAAGRGLASPLLLGLLERVRQVRTTGVAGHALALVAFAIALAARFALDEALPNGFPFLTFFPAIVLTAFVCGRGPATLCAVLSVLASWYWFIPPRGSFALDGPSAVAVAFFAVIAVVDIWVIDVMTASLERLSLEQRRADDLAEQRALLFEDLQHRVANTLTMVGTVLSSQQRTLAHNPEAVAALKAARERLDLMSRLHRRMHDPARLELPLQDYLRDLVEDFVRAHGRSSEIRVEVDAADGLRGLDRRTTLGLLVLELVTNSLKHAFAGRADGCIRITLHPQDDAAANDRPAAHAARWVLRVADDGVGLPAASGPGTAAAGTPGRLGMRLVHSMARALQGELTFADLPPGQGTCAEVRFDAPPRAAGSAASPR